MNLTPKHLHLNFVRRRSSATVGGVAQWLEEEERRRNLFATNNNDIKQENTILKLARNSLPEKQKAIYAGRQHC